MCSAMAKNLNKDLFAYEQEKRQFIEGLRHFHQSRGTAFDKIPYVGKKEIDLYLLYQKVTSIGGWKKVTDECRWDEILESFNLGRGCLNGDQALKFLYLRYLNLYEKVHFLGEDPKTLDTRRDDDGPIRKKLCAPQLNVPLTYNYGQHEIAENLRPGYGLSTDYARFSDYDKLEKALLSGLPNEVDFVINVCTLLSNESKHTLRLDKSTILTDLLLAHIGVFKEGNGSLEKLYENGWRKHSNRDFIKFWFDTIDNEEARKLISHTRPIPKRSLVGDSVLQLGRDQGVDDKEGIRITQITIILRNLSFDEANMKYLAKNDLVFRFLILCIHSNYSTLRQLALDMMGNLAAHIILDPVDSFRSRTILSLVVKCITSSDKFAVVRGLEMVSKLSRLDENEYVLSEKLDTFLYEEIAKYLTVQDIQLIVSSLEALYQLSEIGEETNSKIAEVSNTIDTLVSLITVEAQSYGPNSLVGIKVVEYCPPPHLTGGVTEGVPGSVGPPAGGTTQPPGTTSKQPASSQVKPSKQDTPSGFPQMKTSTCNWLQASYELCESGTVSHIEMYNKYLAFCRRFQLTQALNTQDFLSSVKVVFPRVKSSICERADGGKQMSVIGLRERAQQLPFSIACPPVARPPSCSVASSTASVRPAVSGVQSPALAQRLAAPPNGPVTHKPLCPPGLNLQQLVSTAQSAGVQTQPPQRTTVATVTMPTYVTSGGIAAQGFMSDPPPPAPVSASTTSTPTSSKSKSSKSKAKKKNPPILPRPDDNSSVSTSNLPNIVPKISQQAIVPNVQYTTYPQEIVYQAVDPNNAEAKVMKVKTLLAKKIRQGNVIIQQPIQGVVNVDYGAAGDSQTVQFQGSYQPNSVQQTTYIQYNNPTATLQASVQAVCQRNTSQVQTYVVQSGDVFVQNQLPVSSLNQQQQQLVSQQPLMVSQQQHQQQLQPQQQIFQSHVIPQTQYISQQPIYVSQPQVFVSQQPVFQVAPQMAFTPSPIPSANPSSVPISSFVANPTLAVSSGAALVDSNAAAACATQSEDNNSGIVSEQTQVVDSETPNTCDNISDQDPSRSSEVRTEQSEVVLSESVIPTESVSEPSNVVNMGELQTAGESNLNISANDSVTEIESAVGSIMDDTCDTMDDSQEEPIMIENDGNELMFEPKYQAVCDSNNSAAYVDDEAAMAVGLLEQMEQGVVRDEQGDVSNELKHDLCLGGNTVSCDKEDVDAVQVVSDQMLNNEEEMDVNSSAAMDDNDEELVAKFRSETPIVVPIVSENGLFEQDFEARMAVENLLKDVEFNVNGDDASSEENVNVYSCQQQDNPGSVQTVSSLGAGCEDSRDSVTSESQTSTKSSVLNHNGPVSGNTTKSLQPNHSHSLPHNGISSEHRPLVNGNMDYSVPSPTASLNGGDNPTKLVNGISEDSKMIKKALDKISKVNGVVNHKNPKVLEVNSNEVKLGSEDIKEEKAQDILAQSLIDSKIENKPDDILAQSILENGIEPSECDIPDPEPSSVTAVVKQLIPNTVYGNIMTVQINNNTIPITFTNSAILPSKNSNVCNSRHIPTPESARDGELSCDSTTSSAANSELNITVGDKHLSVLSQSKTVHKDVKCLSSPKAAESKKSKSKKRSRSKSGGSGSAESRSSATSPAQAPAPAPLPEFMCEWQQCRKCFDNARSVFCHVCSVHLKTEFDGLCKWEGCETLIRKRWSLFTHVQDHHCSENSLRVAAQRRLQSFQSGQNIPAPTIPAMVYPNDAATQAIKRFQSKPPYQEFMEGREGPVTKHIRLTSALILRNLARYSPAGRSLLKKHERVISYVCMSSVESSTALANCLFEILKHY